MSLFDDEQIMKTYTKDIKRKTLMENAKHMLKMGKLTVEEIHACYPDLTMDNAKEIEEELMQFAQIVRLIKNCNNSVKAYGTEM